MEWNHAERDMLADILYLATPGAREVKVHNAPGMWVVAERISPRDVSTFTAVQQLSDEDYVEHPGEYSSFRDAVASMK